MTNELWQKLCDAAGDDYVMDVYTKNTILTDSPCFHMISAGQYRAALDRWFYLD